MSPTRSTALVLAAVCAVSVAGCGKKAVPPPPDEASSYVALGDSFAAVAGVGPYTDQACQRTKENYPALVAKKLHLSLDDASCGGAKPEELTQAQKLVSGGIRQPQAGALTSTTRLVTLTIGLNEDLTTASGSIPISAVLTDICGKKHYNPEGCQAYQQLSDAKWATVVDGIGTKVGEDLDQVKVRSPRARIVLVGYPRVLPEAGPCPQVKLPAGAFARLRTTMGLVDKVLKKTAAEAHVEYVDMYTPSKGHDACSADPWVNGSTDRKGEAFEFHPYQAYASAVAAEVVKLLRTAKPQA